MAANTIASSLHSAKQRIAPASDSASLDAQLLLCEVLGVERAFLFTHNDAELTADQIARYDALVARAAAGEPLAYILGRRAWYDMELIVTSDVLIPRPETELLLEQAIQWIDECRGVQLPNHAPTLNTPTLRAVDIGTGSGALAIGLKKHRPFVEVHAVDISPAALDAARANAAKYGADVQLHEGDLLSPFIDLTPRPPLQIGEGESVDDSVRFISLSDSASEPKREIDATRSPSPNWRGGRGVRSIAFDLIMANLPYIAAGDLPDLAVSRYEPRLALEGGADGLALIRRILDQIVANPALLNSPGLVLLEIGAYQAAAVSAMAEATLRPAFPSLKVSVFQDYAGLDRIIAIRI